MPCHAMPCCQRWLQPDILLTSSITLPLPPQFLPHIAQYQTNNTLLTYEGRRNDSKLMSGRRL
jgi:hypothetical protein